MFLRALLFCTLSLAAQAAIIVSVTGPIAVGGGGSIGTNQSQAVGFTLGQNYDNVTISAFISGPADQTYDAYLTTSLGPGTTNADEVAFANLSFPGIAPATYTPVFSGLSLAAGTYYLTLFNPTGSGAWYRTDNPTTVEAPGSSNDFTGYHILAVEGVLPYPPAAVYADHLNFGDTLMYSVEQIDETIPEPATAVLTAFGLLAAALMRRTIARR